MQNKIKIDEKSYKNIIIYYIRYVAVRDLRYVKINSANSLSLITHKINEYIEESSGNKYFTTIPTYESKDALKVRRTMDHNKRYYLIKSY